MSHRQATCATCATCAQHQARRHGPHPENRDKGGGGRGVGEKVKIGSRVARAATEAVAATNQQTRPADRRTLKCPGLGPMDRIPPRQPSQVPTGYGPGNAIEGLALAASAFRVPPRVVLHRRYDGKTEPTRKNSATISLVISTARWRLMSICPVMQATASSLRRCPIRSSTSAWASKALAFHADCWMSICRAICVRRLTTSMKALSSLFLAKAVRRR